MKLELEENDYYLISVLVAFLAISLCFTRYLDYRKTLELRRLAITEGGLIGKMAHE